ncbi:MAG: cytochrome c biogenesis protein CcsA, partial [Coriobacteriia bacterium]|nr:cytochrome c biogenesis protein CcsA [Coriobacteriia bacterium]
TAGVLFSRDKLARVGFILSSAGFIAHTVSILSRWYVSGRLPYVQDFENALAGTWVIMAMYLLLVWRRPSVKIAGIGVLPFVLLTLGYGLVQPSTIGPVTPAYKSVWLVIHVLFAWFTYAAYTACAALAIVEILKSRRKPPRPDSPLSRAPEPERLEDLTLRLVGFGFIVNGAMIASGAVWAYELWGSYWRWDPVETWSLITWVAYALYLHLRLTMGWHGKKLAWVAVLALFGVMMSFWGVQLLPNSYHLFRELRF